MGGGVGEADGTEVAARVGGRLDVGKTNGSDEAGWGESIGGGTAGEEQAARNRIRMGNR